MGKLLLASSSPRRAALLEQLKLSYRVMPPNVDETRYEDELPVKYVSRMAKAKSDVIAQRVSADVIVLAADTIVVVDKEVLGKPVNQRDAVSMLLKLSGVTHQVLTSVYIQDRKRKEEFLVKTDVQFRELAIDECRRYWLSGEASDKAGAYGIQGRGAIFVTGLVGSYSNVVGLPLAEVAAGLSTFGIECLPLVQSE